MDKKMLTYLAIGPFKNGRYAVAYVTPGCKVLTPMGDFPNLDSAQNEATQRNIDSLTSSVNENIKNHSGPEFRGFD